MNTNKFIAGGIIGAIVFFFLGYLLYGLLFKDFFSQSGMAVDMSKMIWWALIVGNVFMGFLLAYVLSKAHVSGPGRGAGIGLVVGLLIELSIDFTQYATGQITMGMKDIAVDSIIFGVMTLITGAIIGWVYGSGKKEKAAAS